MTAEASASPDPVAARAWPRAVFEAAVLRGLDERARSEIQAAGKLRSLAAGEHAYDPGDRGEAFFVVASGCVSLIATRRGDEAPSALRRAKAGDLFGEEATVGTSRRTSAVADEPTQIAEIPVHVFRRAVARAGRAEFADKLERILRRSATRDLLATLSLTRDLPEPDFDVLLDAVRFHEAARGDVIYREGDPADHLWLVADGLVQIQTDDGERLHVRGYVGRGDFFGDLELGPRGRRSSSAVASGASILLSIPASIVERIGRAHPDLIDGLRRIGAEHRAHQEVVVGGAAMNHTQHVFRDLYRLQIARSLLVIDLEHCVRCGHCAWACAAVHGVARLVRRGDKIVAQLDEGGGHSPAPSSAEAPIDIAGLAAPRTLLLPNSCQHCEHPACMVDCPTGAIGRDPEGDVYIREELCTGCGACAKACAWDNIQMAPRPAGAPRPKSATAHDVAVKCDLCRQYEHGPACVAACPTEAILRINPLEDIAELRDLWGKDRARLEPTVGRHQPRSAAILLLGATVAAASVGVVGAVMHARGLWSARSGAGYLFGLLAAAAILGLLAYALPKRAVRLWMKHRPVRAASKPASVVKPALDYHLALGILGVGLALAHAPVISASIGGAALAAFAATAAFGALTWAAYASIPRRLARIERSAALPEDLAQDERALIDRLYREVSGKSDLVKKLFERILLPYVKSPLGPLQLVVSGRTLREEERALKARIDAVLEGRGASRLGGLVGLIRIVVELRAVPAQRWLSRLLRLGLPLHVVTFSVAVVLVGVHVLGVIW